MDGWEPGGAGAGFELTDGTAIVLEDADQLSATAEMTAAELSEVVDVVEVETGGEAGAGDVELVLDPARDDLGEEGYELEVAESVTITAAEPAGVFYGTRTLVQLLTGSTTLAPGSAVDQPEYEERGITLCACIIGISTDFIDRLLDEMSYFKLNYLLLELKLKVDAYPQTHTWSYYSKEQVAELVEKAGRYNIDVIPEINSPGHMAIWLENMPELQLQNRDGERDEYRMDITRDESFEFYTTLIDEYFEVFDSEYWHMGVDEYMIFSGYEDFPQIQEFASETIDPEATPDDVVAWYVNRVNEFVKSRGKTLRIWNDGVQTDNEFVDFDTDIVIEWWRPLESTVDPEQFMDWGHRMMNASVDLYHIRGGYNVNARGLYEQRWTPENFYEIGDVGPNELITGAKFSMWPDDGTPNEAENTVQERMFEAIRFVGQSTWSNSHPWTTYGDFRATMDDIGRPPLWDAGEVLPLDAGQVRLVAEGGTLSAAPDGSLAIGEQVTAWNLEPTPDDYYTLTDSEGLCLGVSRDGTIRQAVPIEIGADVTAQGCDGSTMQRWEFSTVDGGYEIVNAASQQHLSVAKDLVDVPVAYAEPKTVEDGRIVQTPADWGRTVWQVEATALLTVDAEPSGVEPGSTATVTAALENTSSEQLSDLTLRVTEVPRGWTIDPQETEVGDLPTGAAFEQTFTLTNASASSVTGSVSFEAVTAANEVVASGRTRVAPICAAGRTRPVGVTGFSSEQLTGEVAPNGPAVAAVDGDPRTFWAAQWSPEQLEHPHSIVVDLGQSIETCGVGVWGRVIGGDNGRIADYEVYTSESVSTVEGDWGEPAASGTFVNSGERQDAVFAPRAARYVKLVALSEVNGKDFATLAEIEAWGPDILEASWSPSVALDVDQVAPGGTVTASVSGLPAGDAVEVRLGVPGAEPGAEPLATGRADGEGEAAVELTVPVGTQPGAYDVVALGVASQGRRPRR
ncbi:lacto-N-biosidase [Litorihabitans aurantiacus]|uniref:Lacto-N-biosidase n=1 Tax=Litorihabitans aurantiacus TaxID=1930061 RepID=A0AA38CW86_9MICO|nr:lacto-N-biosidase [Litorihabitans aurantiacus]